MDLDSMFIRIMKENSKWISYKDGILNKEFFKWLRNFDAEDYMILILHLLNRLG